MSAALQFPNLSWTPKPLLKPALKPAAIPGTVNLCASAAVLQPHLNHGLLASAIHHIQRRLPTPEPKLEPGPELVPESAPELSADALQAEEPHSASESEYESEADFEQDGEPISTWAFYRKHTESLLRRYLYASTQVGRSPNLLGESVGRGWVSSRRVRTFEDALIFVLDVERCLKRLDLFDRQLITRRILQEYTHIETARLLRISLSTLNTKFPQALDHLTETLVENDLLTLPD